MSTHELAKRELITGKDEFYDQCGIAINTGDTDAFRRQLTSINPRSIPENFERFILCMILETDVTINCLDILTVIYDELKIGRFFLDERGTTTIYTELIKMAKNKQNFNSTTELQTFVHKLKAIVTHMHKSLKLPLDPNARVSIDTTRYPDTLPLSKLAYHISWPTFIALAPHFPPEATEGAFTEFFKRRHCSTPFVPFYIENLIPFATDKELIGGEFYTIIENEKNRRRIRREDREVMLLSVTLNKEVDVKWLYAVLSCRELARKVVMMAHADML